MKKILTFLLFSLVSVAALARDRDTAKFARIPADTSAFEKPIPAADTSVAVMPPAKVYPELTNEYLDTVQVRKKSWTNDYMTIGAQYGVTLSQQYFNPSYAQVMLFNPVYASILFSRYGKMFGVLPYFGFEVGLEYMHSGFKMKQFNDGSTSYYAVGTVDNVMGITEETITVWRVPFRAKFHGEAGPVRFMANLGIYGGYRTAIHREGILIEPIKDSFMDTDYRWDYGLEGGVGIGILLDPVEFYICGLVGWAWESLFEPTSTPSKYNNYYYRFAYPIDIAITFGVHFQLTKRQGKTSSQLRREAYNSVYGNPESKDRK